ncbi:hypothetical protein VNO77_39303 [Canavalia gladiata]|uniref:Uncharacterized protein n=1 Tax=Canavalia gladiata TaxID=3824 RepID=A0AAN9KCB5_CANGL
MLHMDLTNALWCKDNMDTCPTRIKAEGKATLGNSNLHHGRTPTPSRDSIAYELSCALPWKFHVANKERKSRQLRS